MKLEKRFQTELRAFNSPSYFARDILGFSLFPMQSQILGDFYDGGYRELIACLGMRSLSYGTPILFKRDDVISRGVIENIEEGDFVVDSDGRWTKVTGVIRYKQEADVYGFKTKYNETISSSATHKHLINGQITLAKDIKPQDSFKKASFSGSFSNNTATVSYDGLASSNKSIPSKWVLDKQFAYWCGRIVADGWICSPNRSMFSVAFNEQETEALSNFIDWYEEVTNDKPVALKYQRHCYEVVFSCVEFRDLLNNYIGIEGNFLSKRVPSFVFNSSSQIMESFILGYFDGDGMWLPKSDRDPEKWRIGTVNYELYLDILSLCWMLGWHVRRTTAQNWNGRTNYRADVFQHIPHKTELPVNQITVENREEKFVDIEVEGGLFCVDDGIVTHNSGKTVLAATISNYELFRLMMLRDPQKYYGLAPGQRITITQVATSADQARGTIFNATEAQIKNSWWFQEQEMQTRFNEIEFPKYNITILSAHSNSASLAGLTSIMVVLDETSRFREGNTSKSSAESVYSTVSRQVANFGIYGKVVSISSPIWGNDYQMQLLRKCRVIKGLYGYDNPDGVSTMLGYWGPTWEMNPHITLEGPVMQAEMAKNPETFWRDFGAKPMSAQERYYGDAEKIEMAVSHPNGVFNDQIVGEGDPKYRYICAGDPAVKNDSFGLAIIHRDDDRNVICDVAHRFVPKHGREIDANEVKNFLFKLREKYPYKVFITDIWNFPETLQSMRVQGITVKQHIVKKPEHDHVKELIYNKKLFLPENEILVKELKELELLRGTKVDHPHDGSKDIADALANAVNELLEQSWEYPIVVPLQETTGDSFPKVYQSRMLLDDRNVWNWE